MSPGILLAQAVIPDWEIVKRSAPIILPSSLNYFRIGFGLDLLPGFAAAQTRVAALLTQILQGCLRMNLAYSSGQIPKHSSALLRSTVHSMAVALQLSTLHTH
jgi:hypothetical protein